MIERVDLLAATAFGMEAVVARELTALGYEPRIVSTGRVLFSGGIDAVARANINLRVADRVLLRAAHFDAPDFEALFEQTKAFPWERWIPKDAAFPVNGRSVKSRLTSVPAVQRTVKRAIVDRLMRGHRTTILPESGPRVIVEIALLEDRATITLDTSGEGLHKRGYRDLVGDAALKETLAAGLVLLSVWRPDRPLVDPFCGSGTIPIEAAMIGLGIAPGLERRFDAESWPAIDPEVWKEAREQARGASRRDVPGTLAYTIHATDVSQTALTAARRHASRAGVERFIHFARRDFLDLSSKAQHGCIITNPPYGMRLGEDHQVESLYREFPAILRRLPTWSHHILTARTDLESLVGQEATRRRKIYNAQIECTYFQFLGPRPPDGATPPDTPSSESAPSADGVESEQDHASSVMPGDRASESNAPAPTAAVAPPIQPRPAFGGLRDRDRREIDEFEARLLKRARHLRRWPGRGITCYRVYERDCPDVPVVIDRYEDHAHLFEHEREHGRTPAQHEDWLDEVAARTARVLEIQPENVHVKSRPRQRGLSQHEKVGDRGSTLVASEGRLKFEVNLTDYADAGLFLDHRITRGMVREAAGGARFLNLFCYTGSFTVYAASGGARSTVSVDLSNTYMDWTIRNMRLNGLIDDHADGPPRHRFVRSDVVSFLRQAREELDLAGEDGLFDLAVVDPPTFSNSKRTEDDWQVQEGHTEVLGLLLPLMSANGVVYFSTNYRRFKLAADDLRRRCPGIGIQEISARTVPEDFRDKRIHRCWRLALGAQPASG
ncbi:MAG: bifunctional 23S rRNA (guanine(2069)-N(7))-methyltransferase RlmK/23S rRNA (guanine(2445)-N(2))-methyltransferase RlmL [Phycisphaeraceae bacterium]|nr:bifunctional 23S rRNA (guanine(2069)-N(7))-methyltransferase RlmK/23S rRNA (guanine(2445)-N(2))-methyltransferase RlmL [Phycisphaeraceae bacterium]